MNVIEPVAAWFLILMFAVLNGALRTAVLLPNLGAPRAFVISGLLLSAAIVLVATGLARWLQLSTVRRCVRVGLLWLCLTLVFEFGFGWARGASLQEMLAAYRFEEGNIWPVVLLVTFIAPLIARTVRGRRLS